VIQEAIGTGRGKLILCGEHAVVFGHAALAVAVDRGTTVRLIARPGPTSLADGAADERLRAALRAVLPPAGWAVEITSDLPIGRGMGSSAALAVALVRAQARLEGAALSVDAVYERAFAVERVFHGNPSGLDQAVSCRGGLLRFRRGPPPQFEALPLPTWTLVVLDSGVAGDTSAMVAGVAARRPRVDGALERIGALVGRAGDVLQDVDKLGPLLTENHRLLQEIGVSTPDLDDLVRLALEAGAAGAKLAGAGGGGVVLALTHRPDAILQAASLRGVSAFPCRPAAD
jgi:mevalonate kinase